MSGLKSFTVRIDERLYERLVMATEGHKPRLPKRYAVELALERRVIAARGALVIDQALGLEAAEDLVDRTALDLERFGQRQDGTVVALGSGAEDHGLGVAELGHGMISVLGKHRCSPTSPSPGGRTRSGRGREIEGVSLREC